MTGENACQVNSMPKRIRSTTTHNLDETGVILQRRTAFGGVAAAVCLVAIVGALCLDKLHNSQSASGSSLFNKNDAHGGIALYHPRIIINRDLNLESLKRLAKGPLRSDYDALVRVTPPRTAPFCNGSDEVLMSMIYAYGYLYQVSRSDAYADALIDHFLKTCAKPSFGGDDSGAYTLEGYAIAYDWVYDRIVQRDQAASNNPLSPDHGLKKFVQDTIASYYKLLSSNPYLQDAIRESDFHNYMTELEYAYLVAGLALYGDVPQAQEMIERGWGMINDGYSFDPTGFGTSYTYKIKDSINDLTDGAMNWEGPVYWRNAAPETLRAIEAFDTATNRTHDEWHTDFIKTVNAGYYKLYCMRSDLTMPNLNDADPAQKLSWKDNFGLAILESRFQDGYIKQLIDTNEGGWYGGYGTGTIMKLLFYDPKVKNCSFTSLPLARQFGREIYLRSGWGPNDTFITFVAGFGGVYHAHLDNNGFTLFKHADLALNGGGYILASPYYQNYFKRTVASNSITVTDPSECWRDNSQTCTLSNDGGQRWQLRRFNPPYATREYGIDRLWSGTEMVTNPDANELFGNATKSLESTARYDYIRSDATKSYTNRWSGRGDNTNARVSEAVRELFYWRPDFVIILDRVTATDPGFKKAWLLHIINAPAVRNNGSWETPPAGITNYPASDLRIDNGKGHLFIKTLLPGNTRIQVIGGKGYEGWVDGTNYWNPKISKAAATWRIEIQPAVPANADVFLNVLYATNNSVMPTIAGISGNGIAGCLLTDSREREVVMFSTSSKTITRAAYVVAHSGSAQHDLLDLAPGAYDVYQNGKKVYTALSATTQGVLSFAANGGGNFEAVQSSTSAAVVRFAR